MNQKNQIFVSNNDNNDNNDNKYILEQKKRNKDICLFLIPVVIVVIVVNFE